MSQVGGGGGGRAGEAVAMLMTLAFSLKSEKYLCTRHTFRDHDKSKNTRNVV